MSLGTAFWIVFLIWIVFGLFGSWQQRAKLRDHGAGFVGAGIVLLVLLLLLAWQVFGPPLHR